MKRYSNVNQIMEENQVDKEKVLEYNPLFDDDVKKQKKKGLLDSFFKKKQAKEKPSSVTSDEIWREVNLFWPETIAITAALLITIGVAWFSRFLTITGLEQVKPMLSEQVYSELAVMLSNFNTLTLAVGAVPLLILIGFFLYRLFVFQPVGDKFLVARFKTTGGVRLSVDTLKNGVLKFNPKDPLTEEITIKDPRKHFITQTGKPFIVLLEGDDSNANLIGMAGEISQKSKDTNTINDMMFDFGVRWERKMREKANEFLTPTNILLGIILIAIVFLGFMMINQPDAIVSALGG